MHKNIRVLVVDDSAVVRKILTTELNRRTDIEVVGTAQDPYVARDKILRLKPDVITLDIEMPRMDGLTFLKKIMRYHPLPVIIVSSLARNSSRMGLEALSLGALEIVPKPSSAYSVDDMGDLLAEKIRAIATIPVIRRLPDPPQTARPHIQPFSQSLTVTTNKVIAVGASTGGTGALRVLLPQMPRNAPGILVVQHMPAKFTTALAEQLDTYCEMTVKEAENGDPIQNGKVLIAPGNFHMTMNRSGARYFVQIKDGPRVHHQRPAVDNLFKSVALYAGRNAVGILLTGMGADGAKGLLTMKQAGAATIAQDEKSCVVYGMPKEAVRLDAVDQVLPLDKIAPAALKQITRQTAE